MTRSRTWYPVVVALGALALAAGCEKRPTGFDPTPNSPEGVSSPDVHLIAYRNATLRVLVRDYASTNLDSVAVGDQAFIGAPTMPLLLVLDGTPANVFEMYRRDDGGRFVRTTDFPIQSKFKYVNAGFEEFFTTDPVPGRFSPSSYLARGLLDGVATHASPLSNESRLSQPDVLPITYNGDHQPLDSLFVISWVGVPGAVGYWIHAFEKPIAGGQRLQMALPSPIAYLTAGDLLIGYYAGNNPNAQIQYRLGQPLFKLKSTAPLLGRDYYIRISGVDSTGQVIAMTPGDLDSLALSADLAFLAPPSYTPEKTKVYFSLGGTRVTRRTLQRGPAGVGSGEPAAQGTIERHVADLRFPAIRPTQTFKAPARERAARRPAADTAPR